MKATAKLIQISMKSLVRDPGSLFWAFAFPALILLVMGLFWGQAGTPSLQVGVAGPPGAPARALLQQKLAATHLFQVSAGSTESELAALRQGKRHVVLVCPAGGTARSAGARVLRAYYDSRQEQSAELVLAAVGQVVSQVERQMLPEPVGLKMESVPIRRSPGPKPRPVEGFVVAILAVMIIQAGLSAAIAIVADRQKGSSDVFRVTPISPTYMVTGSLVARVILSGIQTLIIVLIGLVGFGIAVRGSWGMLALLVALGTLAFTALGAALGMLARNVQAANGIVAIAGLPLMFLSGLFFPIDVMPGYARSFALALPSTYLGDALRGAVSGVSSITSMPHSIMILTAWTLGCFLFTVRFYRWD